MSQTFTLQIPEEMYRPLVEVAKRRGQSPEEFMLQSLMMSVQHFTEDPFEASIGSVQSNIPDWTEQHDRYLGENDDPPKSPLPRGTLKRLPHNNI